VIASSLSSWITGTENKRIDAANSVAGHFFQLLRESRPVPAHPYFLPNLTT
jgi:hypothetical protein